MKGHYRIAGVHLLLLFAVLFGCTPIRKGLPQGDLEYGCIQGRVWYRFPAHSAPIPYPNAKVTAWRHGTDNALAETQADKEGNYCIELPVGDYRVDLRVWGYQHSSGKNILCRGSEDNIHMGTIRARCGGECIKMDLATECTERIPRRRSSQPK